MIGICLSWSSNFFSRWFIIFSNSKIASSFPPLVEGDLSNFNLWSGNVSDSLCLKTSSTIPMTGIHIFEPIDITVSDFALSMFWSAVGYLSSIRSFICLTRSTALCLKSGSMELQSLNPFIFLPNISSNWENFVAEGHSSSDSSKSSANLILHASSVSSVSISSSSEFIKIISLTSTCLHKPIET
ncbi:hypothetical protein BpHYR1_048764 [Brachionus plicatilis]|uniref:Uncharacterized protein n=1 Tax=Brachionus plicatilis TaxID=10195 RepID=A0A3M7RZ79_BRAPC|nr:hypothetical protein BpHYR1_048764 [Brachionus plicatilis]